MHTNTSAEEQAVTGASFSSETPLEANLGVQMARLLGGFQLSQALYAVAKLDIATALVQAPRSAAEVAAEVGCSVGPVRRLLRDLTGFGVFATAGEDRFAVTPFGATLASNTPGSVRDLALTWMETQYAPFARFVDTVRTGTPAADLHYGKPFFDWLSADPAQVELFTRAMGNFTTAIRWDIFASFTLPAGTTVADIGGASGALLARLLELDGSPERRGIVFDLPHVVPAAREFIAAHGLTDRVEVVGGDFFTAVPTAQVYLLAAILHDWDDEASTRILRAIAAAGGPGAQLVIIELIIPDGDGPHFAKVIDLTMLGIVTGRERTQAEFESLLATAGFTIDQVHHTASPYSLITATQSNR